MRFGVVIPTFNRQRNLKFLFQSLESQKYKDFIVVVADDGSIDGTADYLKDLKKKHFWINRLLYISCGKHEAVRTGRARNIGAANLPNDVTHMIMLDSDLIIDPLCFSNFASVFRLRPDLIIFGQVHWLPPLQHSKIERVIHAAGFDGLKKLITTDVPKRVKGTFVGPELRDHALFISDPLSPPHKFNASWALPLNSAMPTDVFWKAGGYDERMQGYGYQDIEFGVRLSQQKPDLYCLFYQPIIGLHIWHAKRSMNMQENQRNLDYVLRKHGRHSANEVDIDWSIWLHYHYERGGRIVSYKNSLWAINIDNNRRLKLPSQTWVKRLGNCISEIRTITDKEVSGLENMGSAKELTNILPQIGYHR